MSKGKHKIGIKIRQLRDIHGYTQEEIVEILGMSQGNYSKLESGKYKSASAEILIRLANLYGVSINDLLEYDSSQSINLIKNRNNNIKELMDFRYTEEVQKQHEQLIESLQDTIKNLKKIITTQKTQIELLQIEIARLKS